MTVENDVYKLIISAPKVDDMGKYTIDIGGVSCSAYLTVEGKTQLLIVNMFFTNCTIIAFIMVVLLTCTLAQLNVFRCGPPHVYRSRRAVFVHKTAAQEGGRLLEEGFRVGVCAELAQGHRFVVQGRD